jgi:HlyD family secretion protein
MDSKSGPTATNAPSTFATAAQLSERVKSLRLPPPEPARPLAGSVLPWVLFIIAASAAGYFAVNGPAFNGSSGGKPAAVTANSTAATGKSGEATSASTAGGQSGGSTSRAGSTTPPPPGTVLLESKGYIIPQQQILVSPQVSGRIVELNFAEGMRVDVGYVLARLDRTEYEADFDRVEAQVAAAQSRLDELEVGNRPDEIRQAEAELNEAVEQLEQADRQLVRTKDLRTQKIATQQALEEAQTSVDQIRQRTDKLRAALQLMREGARKERRLIAAAELKQAQAELVRSRWRLDNTIIRAPIAGTVLKKNAELGNLVNPVAFNGSFSLCDVADLSKLEVDLNIQERDLPKVFKGQKCKVRVEAFPDRVYSGVVSRLMPIADRAKGALPVRVKVSVPAEEEGMYLKPEMGALVTFFAESADAEPAPAAAAIEMEATDSANRHAPAPAVSPETTLSPEPAAPVETTGS